MIFIFLIVAVCFLAYNNGANDNFKGVATLFGSGTSSYKSAISWATITTFSGSVAAILLAGALVQNFSGKGLVPDELIQAPEFAASIALGAGITVLLATRLSLPISTTHALVGGLFGSGLIAIGSAFNFSKLISTFLVPLIVSPLLAAVISLAAYLLCKRLRLTAGISKDSCICVGDGLKPAFEPAIHNSIPVLQASTQKTLRIAGEQECAETYQGHIMGINAQTLLDYAHFTSAGIVSFARGLNDTPKMVGLLLIINAMDIKWGMFAVAAAMALGGLVNARKVGETVAMKITPMNHGQGFTANLVTGLLVTTASLHGMPVSTTHVSVGSIFGISTATKKADLNVVKSILLSWLLTLPLAAACSAAIYWLLL